MRKIVAATPVAGLRGLVVSECDFEAGLPSGRSSARWRLNRRGRYAAARDHPGDHRVRVPHIPCPKLVAAPYRGSEPAGSVRVRAAHAPRRCSAAAGCPRPPQRRECARRAKDGSHSGRFESVPPSGRRRRLRPRHRARGRSSRGPAPARSRTAPARLRFAARSGRGRRADAAVGEPPAPRRRAR